MQVLFAGDDTDEDEPTPSAASESQALAPAEDAGSAVGPGSGNTLAWTKTFSTEELDAAERRMSQLSAQEQANAGDG